MNEAAFRRKLDNFPKFNNRDYKRLYDLCDILSETESVKEDQQFKQLLAFYDSSAGILPIVQKLPFGIQENWTTHAVRYKRENKFVFPPFTCFVDFLREMSSIKNDPSFSYDTNTVSPPAKEKVNMRKQFEQDESLR